MKGKKPLTIAMLGLSPKGEGESMDEGEEEMGESEDSEEMPPGFLAAVTEMREAPDDESAAKALWTAMQCAGAC